MSRIVELSRTAEVLVCTQACREQALATCSTRTPSCVDRPRLLGGDVIRQGEGAGDRPQVYQRAAEPRLRGLHLRLHRFPAEGRDERAGQGLLNNQLSKVGMPGERNENDVIRPGPPRRAGISVRGSSSPAPLFGAAR
ncbi:hypothetical protein P4118_21455 [Pseudomonas aeruginosa]|nr:hypothetical protein [Pseudomonas aeruginosa]